MHKGKTRAQHLQEIADNYRAEGGVWPAPITSIAEWAIRKGLWQPRRGSLLRQCASELAAAMREEYFTDPQGRRVRKKHVYHELQQMLWVDIEDARPEQMQKAFAHRRRQILGDCHQLKIDVDSYNENNAHDAHIQMCFDFTDDLVEMDQPTQYARIA